MEKDKFPKRKNIHLKNFDYKSYSYVYFITICTYRKENYFKDEKLAKLIKEELIYRQNVLKQINMICYCIMPDHLHILLSLSEEYDNTLLNWVKNFKRYTSKIIKEKHKLNDLWQRGFYEHILRNNESIRKKAIYIMENPIRKEIVKEVDEYPYSRLFFDEL